jgi:hypothetical protein
VIKFQDAGGRMLKRLRDHVFMMVSQESRSRAPRTGRRSTKRRKIAQKSGQK